MSADQLHHRCAPPFLSDDQEFVWGQDLKTNLGEINAHYLQLPESAREAGVYSFASDPPEIGNRVVIQLWDKFIPKWRTKQDATPEPPSVIDIKEEIEKMEAAPSVPPKESPDAGSLDQVVIKRSVRPKRGSWYLIPKTPGV